MKITLTVLTALFAGAALLFNIYAIIPAGACAIARLVVGMNASDQP